MFLTPLCTDALSEKQTNKTTFFFFPSRRRRKKSVRAHFCSGGKPPQKGTKTEGFVVATRLPGRKRQLAK